MNKKFTSRILAAAMAMSMTATAFAADGVMPVNPKTQEADVNLKGTVANEATLLSVIVPVSIDFAVATEAASGATATKKGSKDVSEKSSGGQIFKSLYSGTGTITNNSENDIDLTIVNVVDDDDLLNKLDLALTSPTLSESDALDSPLAAGENSIQLIKKLTKAENSVGTTADIKVVGKGAQGTTSSGKLDVDLGEEKEYTVVTTLKVSTSAS